MRITAGEDYRAWEVYHAQERRMLRNVLWVDDETAKWGEYAGLVLSGVPLVRINQAERIVIDEAALRITVNPGEWPEIPPEVHNTRAVDSDRAMDAVRAMCGEGR